MQSRLMKTLTLVLLISLTATMVSAQTQTAPRSEPLAANETLPIVDTDATSADAQTAVAHQPAAVNKPPRIDPSTLQPATAELRDPDRLGVYIVQLWDPPLALYQGGILDLEATNPSARGESKLDAQSSDSIAYMAFLDQQRAGVMIEINEALGRSVGVLYEYKATLNGFAAEMTPAEAASVAKLPGIKYIERELEYELHTDASPAWMGAPGIWDGSATGGMPGTMGEGVIVGVIDTGIDPWNPSFADIGGDGYDHDNPWGAGNYVGVCDPGDSLYDPSFPCNDKLIGAWGYAGINGGDPRDVADHGSHTASTAAGNFVFGSLITTTDGTVFTADISGIAPHANIVMYAACCDNAALAAAKDQVVLDGVDVVNYSIGLVGGAQTPDPWQGADALQWLAIREAGIYVATSAGNSGPDSQTLGGPGDLPWITTVGASSHDRAFLNTLVLTNGIPLSPTITISGQSMTGPLVDPAQVVFAIDYADPPTITVEDARLCADGVFPAGTFSGEIVVCERGEYGRVAKGQTVSDGGAGGYILAQPDEFGGGSGAVVADPHVLPAVHIDYYEYQRLRAYVASAPVVSGTITGSVKDVDPVYADIMANFSSRGANKAIPDVIVPSVTAPGRAIWAAYNQGPGGDGDYTYNVIGGTSMSSPQVAGAFALIKALHPEWSPAQAQSALMTTARDTVLNDDGANTATPFAQGSGHTDLTRAARAGLVLDVTNAEYEAADPAIGGDPKTLNLASFGNSQCLVTCSWTRTVSSTLSYPVTWSAAVTSPTTLTLSVDPISFTLPAGATQLITVEADVSALPHDEWAFGTVTLIPTTTLDLPPEAHFPVAVQPTAAVLPDLVEIQTRRNAGSQAIQDLQTLEVTELTVEKFGLVQGEVTTDTLSEDPTNDDPYDNLNDGTTFYITETVPSGAKRLVAEITESDAVDIDLYVGQDLNGNGPEPAEELCSSTTPSSKEYCELTNPAAGSYWILVQNWRASASPPDGVTLVTAVVPDTDAGNLIVTGPTSVPAAEPYDLQLFWDTATMQAGDRWYGAFSLGTDASHPNNVGTLPVNLIRHEDDVAKTVNQDRAWPSEVVTYTISIQPNITSEDLSYTITDTIPAGLTYVPGSVTGGAVVSNGVLSWSGVLPTPVGATRDYVVSTNDTDPLCDTGFGGYVNLADFNIFAQPGIGGDTVGYSAFSSGDPINYYGVDYVGMGFVDDGFAIFDFDNYGGIPWVAQTIPDTSLPNNVLAAYWHDFEIVYNAALNHGVALASAGSPGGVIIVEYDDIQLAGGSPSIMDFEIVVARAVVDAPGWFEIAYAYDNVSALPISATIGVEDVSGARAAALVNNGDPTGVITDNLIVCFDYVMPSFDPVEITYQATVDSGLPGGTILTNPVLHNTDAIGSEQASTSASLTVRGPEPSWQKQVWIEGEGPFAPDDSPFSGVEMTTTVTIVDRVRLTYTANISFSLVERWSEFLELQDVELPPGSSALPGMDVISDTGVLTWTVSDLASDLTYVITKTFEMTSGVRDVDIITESLYIKDAEFQPADVLLEFQHEIWRFYMPLSFREG